MRGPTVNLSSYMILINRDPNCRDLSASQLGLMELIVWDRDGSVVWKQERRMGHIESYYVLVNSIICDRLGTWPFPILNHRWSLM